MKVSLRAIKNDTLLGLKDIFSILSNCADLSKAQFILYYYEYHLVNENQGIPDRLLNYLMTENDKGIVLDYNEATLFSNFIFQSVDGKINILINEKKVEIEIIDGDLWEIHFNDEYLLSCFSNNKLVIEYRNHYESD